ncbi:MAG: riboflavin kinase [Rikenellaceae bacterium]
MIIRGKVKRGRGLVNKIGFPTVNLEADSLKVIEAGVYRSKVEVDGMIYDAVTNIGTNPTVGGNPLRCESFIFEFNDDIYEKNITVELFDFIRGEVKFANIDSLTKQIKADIEAVKKIIK